MFDKVKIYIRSGDGGDGLVTFRREKYVPRGGPSGGDGGNGGDIIFKVDPKMNTLSAFQRKVHFKAEHGERGGSSNKTGASASPLILFVPPGTVIRDAETGELIADLVRPNDQAIVAKGGRGGRGNARFVTAANQTPRVAEKGEPGEEKWLVLELKLIADVGIVGVPNAGKSTLLSVVSNARPKIADYPFTTLEPNLGVVSYDERELVFADIPGLIEGAHMGVGLGHAFLRHVQRTRILIHLLNGASENPLADYSQINSELALYDDNLAQKPQIVVYNKIDLPEAQARFQRMQKILQAQGVELIAISSVTTENVKRLVQRVFELIDSLPEELSPKMADTPLYELPEEQLAFTISRNPNGSFKVSGKRIERAAAMTYWDNEDAIMRFQNILESLGISGALEKAGVQVGDTVFIGDFELEWTD